MAKPLFFILSKRHNRLANHCAYDSNRSMTVKEFVVQNNRKYSLSPSFSQVVSGQMDLSPLLIPPQNEKKAFTWTSGPQHRQKYSKNSMVLHIVSTKEKLVSCGNDHFFSLCGPTKDFYCISAGYRRCLMIFFVWNSMRRFSTFFILAWLRESRTGAYFPSEYGDVSF